MSSLANTAKSSKKQGLLSTIRRKTSPFQQRQRLFGRNRVAPQVNPKEQQRLQRLKQQAFHELDQQIRREQMALVRRIRYLDSLPESERELLLEAERAAVESESESDDEDECFQEMMDDICAIDIGEDDFVEIVQFEHDELASHWNPDTHDMCLGFTGDLF
ncbi:hypothetical protein HKX48_003557 [Thoreauomyces humboldtii]|nr:hypothetical protein HKX48_003557 [Thoreauomyces humboldtii]